MDAQGPETREAAHHDAQEDEWQSDDESVSSSESQDSEDPETWGPYFWSDGRAEDQQPGAVGKVWDVAKFASFKAYRKLHFAGEVMVHFFGLHQPSHQWVIDAVDRERRMEEEQARIDEQRRALRSAAEAADPRAVSNQGEDIA